MGEEGRGWEERRGWERRGRDGKGGGLRGEGGVERGEARGEGMDLVR